MPSSEFCAEASTKLFLAGYCCVTAAFLFVRNGELDIFHVVHHGKGWEGNIANRGLEKAPSPNNA